MRPAKMEDRKARGRRPSLGILMGLGLLLAGGRPPATGQNLVTSNTKVLLEGTVFDHQSGENVALFGLVHVQTKLYRAQSLVAVHANLSDAVLAYGVNDPTPDDPTRERLNSLSLAAKELQARLNALYGETKALQQELQEVLMHDLNPFLPGIQYDKERAAALQRRIDELSAEFKRLQKELAELADEIASLVEEIQNQRAQEGEIVPLYEAFGAYGVVPAPCSLLGLCERKVSFDLVRSGGGRTRFDVQLSLLLSDLGQIISAGASVAEDDGGDHDACPCP